jgi:hypothetical protein
MAYLKENKTKSLRKYYKNISQAFILPCTQLNVRFLSDQPVTNCGTLENSNI